MLRKTKNKIRLILFFQYVIVAMLAILIFIDLVIKGEQKMIVFIFHLISAVSIILIIGIFDNIEKELYLPNVNATFIPNVNATFIPNVNSLSVNMQPSAPIMNEHSLI